MDVDSGHGWGVDGDSEDVDGMSGQAGEEDK